MTNSQVWKVVKDVVVNGMLLASVCGFGYVVGRAHALQEAIALIQQEIGVIEQALDRAKPNERRI